jgi:ABC-type Fe3+-siderophore transport system permease subunit
MMTYVRGIWKLARQYPKISVPVGIALTIAIALMAVFSHETLIAIVGIPVFLWYVIKRQKEKGRPEKRP